MPEEMEILRINIILPEDSADILALAPKDVDTKKKDKIKKWVEKSFKNLERLKLNLGGELDAEGFFGMESQGDVHPEKVLLCIYSKDKVKLSSFVALLGSISFRPSTSKNSCKQSSRSRGWKTKALRYGGYLKHTELVRFRKVLKRRRKKLGQFEQSLFETQPDLNFSSLQYYKPYIVDRNVRSKPTLKSLYSLVPGSEDHRSEMFSKEKMLRRMMKDYDLNIPLLIHSTCMMEPFQYDLPFRRNQLNNWIIKQCLQNEQGDYIAYETDADVIKNKKEYFYDPCKEGERKPLTGQNHNRYQNKPLKGNADESTTNKNSLRKNIVKRRKMCKHVFWPPSHKNSNDFSSVTQMKNCEHENGKNPDDALDSRVLESDKIGLGIFENDGQHEKGLWNNDRNLSELCGIKPIKSVGIQVPSRVPSNDDRNVEVNRNPKHSKMKNRGHHSNQRIIEEEFKRNKEVMVQPKEKGKSSISKKASENMSKDKSSVQKSWNVERSESCKKKRRNRKTSSSCSGRQPKKPKSQWSCHQTHVENYGGSRKNSSKREPSCSMRAVKVSRHVRKQLKQRASYNSCIKLGMFRKLFDKHKPTQINSGKNNHKRGKNIKYFRKIYVEEDSDFDGSDSDIIKVKFQDCRNKRKKDKLHNYHDGSTPSSRDETVNIADLASRKAMCERCGHATRVRTDRSQNAHKNAKNSKVHKTNSSAQAKHDKRIEKINYTKQAKTDNIVRNTSSGNFKVNSCQRKHVKTDKKAFKLHSIGQYLRNYDQIYFKDKNNIIVAEYFPTDNFNAKARVQSKNIIELMTRNHRDESDEGFIMKQWNNTLHSAAALTRTKKKPSDNLEQHRVSDSRRVFEETVRASKQLSSIVDIVKIKTKTLNLEQPTESLNFKVSKDTLEPDFLSTSHVQKSDKHSLSSSQKITEAVGGMNKVTASGRSFLTNLTVALGAMISHREIKDSRKELDDKPLERGLSGKEDKKRKSVTKSPTVSRDHAKLSLVKRKAEAQKPGKPKKQDKNKTETFSSKHERINSSEKTSELQRYGTLIGIQGETSNSEENILKDIKNSSLVQKPLENFKICRCQARKKQMSGSVEGIL